MQVKKAVIDRIVDGQHAVLLIGEEESEMIVPTGQLPEGAKEGSWLTIDSQEYGVDESSKLHFILDAEQTDQLEADIADTLSRLKSRGTRSRFKKTRADHNDHNHAE